MSCAYQMVWVFFNYNIIVPHILSRFTVYSTPATRLIKTVAHVLALRHIQPVANASCNMMSCTATDTSDGYRSFVCNGPKVSYSRSCNQSASSILKISNKPNVLFHHLSASEIHTTQLYTKTMEPSIAQNFYKTQHPEHKNCTVGLDRVF